MKPTILLTASLLAGMASPLLAQQSAPAPFDTIAVGREATMYLYSGRVDSLWAMVDSGWQKELGSPDWFVQRSMEIQMRGGTEDSVVSERVRMRNGQPQYWRTVWFSKFQGKPVVIRWVNTPEGKIGGLGMNPESRNPPTDDEKP